MLEISYFIVSKIYLHLMITINDSIFQHAFRGSRKTEGARNPEKSHENMF